MKRIKIWLSILCVLMALSFAVGCSKDKEPDNKPDDPSEESKDIVLADFEKWAPDFQTLRLRNEFGSIDVNTDADYVKSGKQSAALTVVGAEGSENPWFYVNTVSTRFEYDYSDFSCIDSVSAWFYNASDTDEQLHMGLITNIVSIEQSDLQKYDTFTLKPGWNEVVYEPDMNYIISALGKDSYEGIQGVYFMFENPHAATRADGKRFYVDDITLHYGEEKPFTEVRAGTYYASGTKIGAPRWIILDNPIKMKDLTGKALHFEFKFDSDTGRFGFAICCNDYQWSNITGTLIIEKTTDGIFANMGRIVELEDGWYAWELNSDMFEGDGADTAEDVSLIYHQNEVVQGNVIIDWKSMRAVDAYPVTREERSEKLTDGDLIYHSIKNGVPMADLAGKALQFEFKFASETGKFGFAFMDGNPDGWQNITGTLLIKKKNGKITSNIGKIVETGDGWYAWRIDSELFAGDGAPKAKIVDLACDNNGIDGIDTTVQGTVYIDWNSVKAVDLNGTREELSDQYTDGGLIEHHFRSKGISMADLSGKALQFEFKFASAEGKFGFAFIDSDIKGWKNVTGTLVIEKKDGKITSNIGKIEETGDGWYAWKLNSDQFAGSDASTAKIVDFAYHDNGTHGIDTTVQGTVYIDWKSTKAVDAYKVTREERSDELTDGGLVWHYFYGDGISMANLAGKALQFEFKFDSPEGKFGFAFMDNEHDWANITGTIVIEKKDGKITSNIGKIEETGDGWYAWKLNSNLFAGGDVAKAKTVDLAYHNDGTDGIDTAVQGTVYIDWKSMKAVDAYKVTREESAQKYISGDEIYKDFNKDVPMADLSGKALQFEFKFTSKTGKFGFALMDNDWTNVTGTLVIEKKDSGEIVSNIGKIEETGDGWYAWKLNRAAFAEAGASTAQTVGLAYHNNGVGGIDTKVQGTVYIDWESMKAADAYSREKLSEKYIDGDEIYKDFSKDVPMADLSGKALQFEFKFTSETGKFGFALMDNTWRNITGTLVIEKKDGELVSNIGRIVETKDGWYAWQLNGDQFAGNGAADAQEVGLAYHNNTIDGINTTVQGEVYIDWDSLKVVDAYAARDIRDERATKYTSETEFRKYFDRDVITREELNGKALHLEFKFTTETGRFGFDVMDKDWRNITGNGADKVIIEKTSEGITASMGRIIELENGWYAWELNSDQFKGDGWAEATGVGVIYHQGVAVTGEVLVDWEGMRAADAYAARAARSVKSTEGNGIWQSLSMAFLCTPFYICKRFLCR